MDFDDILAAAIASVEKETENSSSAKPGTSKVSPVAENFISVSIHQNNDFNDDSDDILALALEDVEKETQSIKTKAKALKLVDIPFGKDSNENSSLSKSPDLSSVIHTGDTDSSEDEDNRYFEEAHYDSYGKSIRNILKDRGKISDGSYSGANPASWSAEKKKKDPLPPPPVLTEPKTFGQVDADPIFGIRIIHPLVSSQAIREVMRGRTPIGCFKLKNHILHGDLKSDWVFAGVLVRKLPPRVSQNGNKYSMWILSDLKQDLKTVCLFLFGRAHDELWKTPSGVVLALLNPGVLGDDKKKSEYEAKLSIKTAEQVMIWGKSRDLGQCKSRKKDGEVCGAFVNVSQCEYCVYHVKQEYGKFNSRADFGTTAAKANLRNKVLGKNEVFYGGKSYTAISNCGKKATNPKDKDRLLGLGTPSSSHKTLEIPAQVPSAPRSNGILKLLGNDSCNNKKSDVNLLSMLNSTAPFKKDAISQRKQPSLSSPKEKLNSKTSVVSKKPTLSKNDNISFDIEVPPSVKPPITPEPRKNVPIKNKLQQRFNNLATLSSEGLNCRKKSVFSSIKKENQTDSELTKKSLNTPSNAPEFQEVSDSNKSITKDAVKDENKNTGSLCVSPGSLVVKSFLHRTNRASPAPPNAGMSKAKLKALALIKSKGPISKENPTGMKGVKRTLPLSDEESVENEKPVISQRFLELMNQKSIHEDLVDIREQEAQDEYFTRLEKKDRLEEKMLNTFKVDCKAVKCLKCGYTWFSAAEACKSEGHPTKVIDAVKRFFRCGQCSNRTVSLTLIPLIPCKKCSSSNWIRAPMIREKIAKSDELSIRGGEQKYVNSVISNGSLNLLVPD